MKTKLRRTALVALSLLCIFAALPSAAVVGAEEVLPCAAVYGGTEVRQDGGGVIRTGVKTGGGTWAAGQRVVTPTQLIPGGMPFGLRMHTRGLLVVGTGEVVSGGHKLRPAYDAGLRAKDILLSVDGSTVSTVEELTARIGAAGGKPLTLTVARGNEQLTLQVTPVRADADGRYQCGLLVRDTASGIGTVTFIDPESGLFGGLGHGVCDADTGAIMPLSRGTVTGVRIRSVIRGEKGKPGELRGSITAERIGLLAENNECGVFGALNRLPTDAQSAAIPVGTASEVKEGAATVRCTLGEDGVREYAIEILRIDHSARPTKSFTVRVTDPALLERTGGIVQGMSGSPIIQNGKLIGAVTHVLVDDPTTGYGIFIENMLSHMKMRAAA